MIGWLQGVVRLRDADRVVVDVGGIGYVVHVPLGAGAHLELEASVELHVHTHVREDSFQLFGFESSLELSTFETLITVTGVGPKLAQSILGTLAPSTLAEAVDRGDTAVLKKVPGVGKRVADRLSLELRGKLRCAPEGASMSPTGLAQRLAAGDVWRDLGSALANLQYRKKEVDSALELVRGEHPGEGDFDTLLRAALAVLRR